jgi:hypothetical protein
MRVRPVPSLVRTLAIFLASLHASGSGFGALGGAPALAQAPAQPVLQTDALRPGSASGAEEIAGQTLLFVPSVLSSPIQDGSEVRSLDASPAVAPARPPSTRDPRSTHAARGEPAGGSEACSRCFAIAWARDWPCAPNGKAPQRIRAP